MSFHCLYETRGQKWYRLFKWYKSVHLQWSKGNIFCKSVLKMWICSLLSTLLSAEVLKTDLSDPYSFFLFLFFIVAFGTIFRNKLNGQSSCTGSLARTQSSTMLQLTISSFVCMAIAAWCNLFNPNVSDRHWCPSHTMHLSVWVWSSIWIWMHPINFPLYEHS